MRPPRGCGPTVFSSVSGLLPLAEARCPPQGRFPSAWPPPGSLPPCSAPRRRLHAPPAPLPSRAAGVSSRPEGPAGRFRGERSAAGRPSLRTFWRFWCWASSLACPAGPTPGPSPGAPRPAPPVPLPPRRRPFQRRCSPSVRDPARGTPRRPPSSGNHGPAASPQALPRRQMRPRAPLGSGRGGLTRPARTSRGPEARPSGPRGARAGEARMQRDARRCRPARAGDAAGSVSPERPPAPARAGGLASRHPNGWRCGSPSLAQARW